MQVNCLKFIKIYAHLIIVCIKLIPTCVILIDRENPDEQLHGGSLSVNGRKYLYKEIEEIRRINFNRHLKVEKVNSLPLLFINVLQI